MIAFGKSDGVFCCYFIESEQKCSELLIER